MATKVELSWKLARMIVQREYERSWDELSSEEKVNIQIEALAYVSAIWEDITVTNRWEALDARPEWFAEELARMAPKTVKYICQEMVKELETPKPPE